MKTKGWIRGALALTFAMMTLAGGTGHAEQAPVILACSPTWEAIDTCQSSGGRYDTLRCRCVRGNFNFSASHPCALVCIDGFLDAQACRCVHPKHRPLPRAKGL